MKRNLVVLMGLDGSGKSTQAQLLANWLRERGVTTEVVWMRGESYVTLPVLRMAKALLRAPRGGKRGEPGRASGAAAPGRVAASGPASDQAHQAYARYVAGKRSLFKSGIVRAVWRSLVLLDFYITFRVAFARLARTTRLVILDRYYYDSLVDLDSGFGSGGTELKRLLASSWMRIFPRPGKVILLEIDSAHAMRRKDDIPSVEYLEERRGLYRAVAEEIGASVVDATRSIDDVRTSLLREISEFASSAKGPSRDEAAGNPGARGKE